MKKTHALKSTFSRSVTIPSIMFILLVSLMSAVFPEITESVLETVKEYISFIARISKGRTIREFIAAVLIIPTLFNFIWMGVFGNSAIWMDFRVANGALSSMATDADALTFRFLEYLPFTPIVSVVVILVIIIFFVTSADSGILVMNSISTKNARRSPKWQMLMWGVALAALALLLLNAGGLQSLQTMTLITALPFSIIMLLFIVSLMKALSVDQKYYTWKLSASTVPWSGEFWKDRLKQIISFKDKKTVVAFIKTTVKEAFTDLQKEFTNNEIREDIRTFENPYRLEIHIPYNVVNNFIYGVQVQTREISEFVLKEKNLPDAETGKNLFLKLISEIKEKVMTYSISPKTN